MELIVWSLFWGVRVLCRAVLLPVMAARYAVRNMPRFMGAWSLAIADTLACPSCRRGVSLVGRWQCGRCGYVFDGFAFARCAICGGIPPYLPCTVCGAGLRNPTHVRTRIGEP
jgi:ribosomal protein L37AE/L43A